MPSSEMKTYLITGATSGLGLRLARLLTQDSSIHLIATYRSDEKASQLRGLIHSKQLTLIKADLSSIKSVNQGISEILKTDYTLSGVILNAGIQMLNGKQITQEGLEATFVINHLSHALMVERLQSKFMPNCLIITLGSGTHHPGIKLATSFGFRGALYPSFNAVSTGEISPDGDQVQEGFDRYATSKLCNILYAKAIAKENKYESCKVICFDPGLMPGTHLARDQPMYIKVVWFGLLPLLAPFIPGASSPRRSARVLHQLITSQASTHQSGSYLDYRNQPAPASKQANDHQLAESLYHESLKLIEAHA